MALAAAAAVLAPVGTNPSAAQSSGSGDGVVVIANGWSPPDVGAAAPLAGWLDAAVLYASKDELGQPTIDALEELNPSRVLLMGGPVALTPAVQSQVRRVLSGATVKRFSGDDRIDTAAKAALSAPAVSAGRPVVIANGWSPPDVGAAAPLAASLGGSVLFANKNSLGAPTVAALQRLEPSQVVIVGGTAALSGDIESQIAAVVPGVPTERLGGVDRVDTAARGAALAPVELGEPVVLANGWDPADVGIAAPLAAALGGSVLFTQRNALSDRTAEALADLSPSRIILIGGSDRLATRLDAEFEELRPGTPRLRIAGASRIDTAATAALFGVQFSTQQQRFDEAVATITPEEADCDAAPQLDVTGVEVVDPPADLNDPTAPLTVAEVVRIAGGCLLVDYVELDGRSVAEVRERLTDEPTVFAVGEPVRDIALIHDIGAHTGYGPGSGAHYNDGADEQWHLPQDYMEKLWDGWDSATPITVAVLDSGVDTLINASGYAGHPDFRGRISDKNQRDCDRVDPSGHGTHVAGIIAAAADGQNVAGVAPQAHIRPIRLSFNLDPNDTNLVHRSRAEFKSAYSDECQLKSDGISATAGIANAVNNGARVINMSFRTPAESDGFVIEATDFAKKYEYTSAPETQADSVKVALMAAYKAGVVNIAAAGNCGSADDRSMIDNETGESATKTGYEWNKCDRQHMAHAPASYDEYTISVASIDADGQRSDFSTANSHVDIAAPGSDIVSALPRELRPGANQKEFEKLYGPRSGTSQAAPFVAGVVAHMLNRYPQATPAQIRQALENTAADRGPEGRDEQYGYGIVRPREAIFRLHEILGLNRIYNIRVTAEVCAPDDDTPSCPEPAVLTLRATSGSRSRSPSHYSVEVPRAASYMSVTFDYEHDERPRAPYAFPPDSESQAGHQFRFPTHADRTQLTISLFDWKGDPYLSPYVLNFTRAGSDQAETEPELASLGVWDRSCGPGLSSGPHVCPSGSVAAIAPGFDPAVRSYSVTVPEGTQLVTIDRVAAAGFELGEASPADADPLTPGYQVRVAAPVSVPQSDRADKPATSAAVGERFLEVVGSSWSGAVIIASAENFPDGLAAASLAGALRAPILLTPRDRLHPAVAEFIRDHPVGEIVIMGGPAAISNAVQDELRRVSGITNVPRLWGADRYETAIEIAERVVRDAGDVGQLCGTSSRAVFIATGRNSADALAASPAAYAAQMPVLLVDPKARALHAGVADFIEDHGIDTAVIQGGTSAVPARVHEQLSDLVSINRVSRVAGPDRFATAAQLARDVTSRCYDHGVEAIGLANGQGFEDALAAGPLVAELNGVMLLTRPDDVPPATVDAMTQIGKEAQLTNITLALLAIGDIAQTPNAVTKANNTSGRNLHRPPALGAAKTIAAGADHTCAIAIDSTVVCWNANGDVGTTTPAGRFTALSAGDSSDWYPCGIMENRTIRCWGEGRRSESPAGEFTDVAVGRRDACGIRTDGAIQCWGNTRLGGSRVLPPGHFTSISSGNAHRCAIRQDRSLKCFGIYGGIHEVEAPGPFVEVTTGHLHTCAIAVNGTVQCWGQGVPKGRFISIDAGGGHTCGIRVDGTVECWGDNQHGQAAPPTGAFAAISAGLSHTCGIRPSGAIECWGGGGHKTAPPSGQFMTEVGAGSQDSTPPLSDDVEKIAVLALPKPTARQVSVTVVDPKRPGVTTSYQMTIRQE